MNIPTLLLCVLVTGAKSNDIFPARILAPQKRVKENSNLHVTCSTFGSKKNTKVFVYLCQNGIGIDRHIQELEENDTGFRVHTVTLEHSGNYSCVYSEHRYQPIEVKAKGKNIIEINVIANFHPANLSLSGLPRVSQGEQVEFLCSLPNVLQTLGDCDPVQSYLMQDGTINQVQGFNVKSMKAKFVVQDVVQKDSGRYSCVVLPSQCFKENDERLSGNNVVVLEVKESFPFELTLSLTVGAAIVLVVCLLTVFTKDANILCTKHPQMSPESTVELQECIEEGVREELSYDKKDDSFENEEEESYDYQNAETAGDPDPIYDDILSSGLQVSQSETAVNDTTLHCNNSLNT